MTNSAKMALISGAAVLMELAMILTELTYLKVGDSFNVWLYIGGTIFIMGVFGKYSADCDRETIKRLEKERQEKTNKRKTELADMSDMDFYNLTFVPVNTEEFKLQTYEITKRWRALVTKGNEE